MTDSMAGGKLHGRTESIKHRKFKHNPVLRRTGVYEIVCVVTGKRYIGSTTQSFRSRFGSHRHELRAGKHHSRHLQRAWNKHGEDAFCFNPLIFCEAKDVLIYEQMLINAFKPEFNISPMAGNTFGVKHTEEARKRGSEAKRLAWANGAFANRDLSTLKTSEYRALRSKIMKQSWAKGAFANKKPRDINTGAKYDVMGEMLTIRQIAEKYNFNPGTIQFRISAGLSGNDLIAPLFAKLSDSHKNWRDKNPEAVAERGRKSGLTRSHKYDVRGEMLTHHEIASKYGFKIWTIKRRIEKGMRGEDLISPLHDKLKKSRKPWGHDHKRMQKLKRYFVRGEYLTIPELAEKYGLDKQLLFDRRKRGVSGDALIRPKQVSHDSATACGLSEK